MIKRNPGGSGHKRKNISALSAAIDSALRSVEEDSELLRSDAAQPEVARIRRRVLKAGEAARVRSKSIAPKRLTRDERRLSELLVYPDDVERPKTREQCSQTARPCPFVSCSHHLYLDVNSETGAIKLNFPHLEVWEMAETCALDVADRGGITLEEVGAVLNLTRERIRQVEVRGLTKLRSDDFEGSTKEFAAPAGTPSSDIGHVSCPRTRAGLSDPPRRTSHAWSCLSHSPEQVTTDESGMDDTKTVPRLPC
jgi:hypothetical protein